MTGIGDPERGKGGNGLKTAAKLSIEKKNKHARMVKRKLLGRARQ